jgi:galactokinase
MNCDVNRLGTLLNQSHASSRDNIRSSTPEIDSIVKEVQDTPGVLGARLMGGGHGGMILALIENEGVLPGELLVPSDSAFFEEAL